MTQAPNPLAGWLPEELEVLTHVRRVLDSQLLHLRHGSRARRVAEAERAQTLADAGLDEEQMQAWTAGGMHPRRGIAVELAPGEQLVALPPGYDDASDRGRPRLIAKLHGAISGDPQVQTIVWSADRTRCAAIVGTPSWRPRGEARAIPEGVRDAGQVDSHLRESGQCLLAFDPPAHRLLVGNLAPFELALRDRLAAVLKKSPWEVRLSTTWGLGADGKGELQSVVLPAAPVLTADPDKAQTAWQQVTQSVVGHEGWTIEMDHHAGTVTMRSGIAVDLPSAVAYAWSVIDDGSWGEIPFGTDGFGRPVIADLSANPHTLVVGKTGSGKSIQLEAFIYAALIHGFELAICDPTKRGLDFRWARPYVRPGGWGCQGYGEALAVIRGCYDEGRRRLDVLDSLDCPKWTALTPAQRTEYGIRPIMVIVDEGTSLAKLEPVMKTLPPDDPERVEAEELNADKSRIMAVIGKIARELRFVGVHLVFGTQRFSVADIGDGAGGLRENLGVRILLGRASNTAIDMAFADSSDAMAAYAQAHGVAASADPGKGAEKRPGRGVCEIDGMITTAFQGSFATHEELVAALRARGIAKADSDGRPRLVETPVVGGVPELMPLAPAAAVVDVGEMEFTFEDEGETTPADDAPSGDDDGWAD